MLPQNCQQLTTPRVRPLTAHHPKTTPPQKSGARSNDDEGTEMLPAKAA